ncbi:MAG: shikimate dehydrogenase [Anaerolineae bacterium SM23_ 63]|nr:MAG: shikimate dehydrogenase [Anaerolineae bacterium SM23_ 63]
MDQSGSLDYQIIQKSVPTFYFVGVTTRQSSIIDIFPLWMEALGRPEIIMEGVDHALHDQRQAYRQTVAQIKNDPLSLGGLITAHKIDILEAAGDMFDVLHPSAEITGEISCVSKRNGMLIGHAKDPLTSGMSLDAMLGEGYFGRMGGEVLIFGAGGSGKAICLHFIHKEDLGDRPKRIVVVNRSKPRLDQLQLMVENLNTDINFEYICNEDPKHNDEIMAGLAEGSVVINATGLGKDRPGSPITDKGLFPRKGIAWEINYRGELDFWYQAIAQVSPRNLTVEDGWLYFLHGWTQHIAEVLRLEITSDIFSRLSEIAEELRPRLVPQPRPGASGSMK